MTKDFIHKNKIEQNYFVPCYRGKDIDKYFVRKHTEYLFYPYAIVDKKTRPIAEDEITRKCPIYIDFLKANENLILKRPYFAKSNKKWYELWNQRDMKLFNTDKIITPELSERNRFALAKSGHYYGDTVCGIKINDEYTPKVNIKYLLSILNSKLVEWFYKKTTVPKAGGFFIYKVMFLKNIPIPVTDNNYQEPLIELVDKILHLTKTNDYLDNTTKQTKVKEYERQIDEIVYELYGLTEEEIAIVEGTR